MDLFRQYGFKTITMDDIARGAGISKKTLYQHFANKDEVVDEGVTWFHNQTFAQVEKIFSQSANAVEGMVEIMNMLDSMYRQINPMAMLELQRYFPGSYKTFRERSVEKDVAALRQNIERGMAEGNYRPNLNADFVARYRIESCMMLFQPSSLLTGSSHPHLVGQELSELFIYGILTARGQKLYEKYKEQHNKKVQAS